MMQTERATVLMVDDVPDNLLLLATLLKGHYRVKVATSGERALAIARARPAPELILLDVMMPGMDGYEVCAQLKADPRTAAIPVIFLTARTDQLDEQRGFDAGAVDYVSKPVSPPLVLARVRTHLELKRAQDGLRDRNRHLDGEVARQLQEIEQLQDGVIIALATLAEARDNETANHLRRTQHYVRETALRLRAQHPRYAAALAERDIEVVFKAVPLHDIGKIGVPDRVLLQPGRYTREDWELAARHTTIGAQALVAAERSLGYPNPFLAAAREIAQNHHERWDGKGYPQGLAGEEIPLAARLMAVADTYDALVTRRFHKNPVGHQRALETIREGRGTQFDPDVADAFLSAADTMARIAQQFGDRPVDFEEKLLQIEEAIAERPM
jgi:putative two-component system response regulator